jgi:hypothetical protein
MAANTLQAAIKIYSPGIEFVRKIICGCQEKTGSIDLSGPDLQAAILLERERLCHSAAL